MDKDCKSCDQKIKPK